MPFLSGRRSVLVFSCFAAAYFFSYAFRSINAVIAPALMSEIGLSNADLGLLSSAYFFAFASLQLPLGVWLDKYGARRTEAGLLLFAAAGAMIFASSTTLAGLWLGRALLGMGVSACLMAPFKAYRQWYAPQRQSQLASWMLVVGTSGALAATIPVTAALPLIGWRGIFWGMGVLILAAAAAIYFFLGEVERSMERPTTLAAMPAKEAYRLIFSDRYFQRMALLGLVNQASFIALQSLWAGPWMMTVLGMSRAQTSQILFVFNFSLMLAYVVLGWWAPRHVERGWSMVQVVAVGLFGTLLAQAAIICITASWAWIFWMVLAVCVTVATLVQTHVSMSFPSALAGRANTAFNLLTFVGAFLVQWGVGIFIDVFQAYGATPVRAMQGAFVVCLAFQAAALFAFVFSKAHRELATT